ncbi:Gamma carbonic anhydrase-like mitochondrial [Micractinium conductrix]|uniref:Gamma carbonic anhydrase-like mitochondrial n=1 Tax=Micractinium conductrix TaxID=554055 RepID=A0A2P6VEL6_9CHLO|nr:Gamma carbonic anhydrase-like mitochondrial [Micractinium conductrix]|eukprot:PSC72532.1 Gamma carbonic anhydrase-like mitochondrial [Micractinium conductrix]
MRRAAALLASRLPAGAALEAGQPSTSASVAVVAQWGRAFTSTAAARVPVHPEEELYNRQRQFIALGNRVPTAAPDTWVAPNAVIVGDVDLYDRTSIWYGCVLRGDLNHVKVGAFSNVQDRTVITAARSSPTGLPAATVIGRNVTIGQSCLLRSTTIEDEAVVGDKCVLLEGSLVEKNSVLAPGSVLPPGRRIPSGQLWAGSPAKYVRDLSKDEKAEIVPLATSFFRLVDAHSSEFLPHSSAWREAEILRAILKPDSALVEGSTLEKEQAAAVPHTSPTARPPEAAARARPTRAPAASVMEPAEVPVLEEHAQGPGPVDSALLPPPAEEEAPRAGLSLALQLPPGTAAGPDRVSRRWSLDGAGSEHGASSEHDWELLSHGHHSYCGSSPRSVSASEAYDSEGEAEGEAGRRRLAGAADQLGGTPLGGDAEHAEQEPGLQPFGSLVMPAHEHLAAAAAAADEGSDEARGAAAADRPASPPPSAPFSAASTPRSSYGHASSRTSRHDLYSLSQDGSCECLSERDMYIDEMMAQGEPDLAGASEGEGDAPAKPAPPTLVLLAASPGATLGAAARGAYVAASGQLGALAASVTAYLARVVPASAEVAQRVALGVAELMGSLHARLAAGGAPPLGLGSLAAHAASARSSAAAAATRVQLAAASARKRLGYKHVNWAKVSLALGGACGVLAVLLYRSWAENARVSATLARRETDFASLLMRIAELQRNISYHTANSRVPIIRHVATAVSASSASVGAAYWPAVVVVSGSSGSSGSAASPACMAGSARTS